MNNNNTNSNTTIVTSTTTSSGSSLSSPINPADTAWVLVSTVNKKIENALIRQFFLRGRHI